MSNISVDYLNTHSVPVTWTNNVLPLQNSSGFTLPNPSVTLPKTLSYDFRVAEYVNENDEVVKVGLQVAVFEHDNYGVRQLRQDWTDVERVRLPFAV